MHIKGRKYIYNRHQSGTEVYETRWTTKQWHEEEKEGYILNAKWVVVY